MIGRRAGAVVLGHARKIPRLAGILRTLPWHHIIATPSDACHPILVREVIVDRAKERLLHGMAEPLRQVGRRSPDS